MQSAVFFLILATVVKLSPSLVVITGPNEAPSLLPSLRWNKMLTRVNYSACKPIIIAPPLLHESLALSLHLHGAMTPSILQSHHLYSYTTVKNADSKKIKLKHPMEIVLIFWANHTLQLLITPVGALQHNTSLFTGIESDWSNCKILCSSHTHTYMRSRIVSSSTG